MRILHLITGLGRGGAENMLYKLLATSDAYDIQPTVATLTSAGVYGEKISALGVPVYSFGMRRSVPSPLALVRLRRHIDAMDPDVIHGWMYHGALAGLLAAKGKPVVVAVRHTVHDITDVRFMTRVVIKALGALSGTASAICYNSQVSQKLHERLGYRSQHSSVIPNGFDTDLLRRCPDKRAEMRAVLGLRPDQIAVLHLARFYPSKNHAGMLEAARRLLPDPRFVFVFAGTDVTPDNPAFVGLDAERFRLLGEWEDIPELLSAADLLCLSSWGGEAFPNVLGEAMASGLPCVATDVGDSSFIVGDTGLVVPRRDPEALANAILQIADLGSDERAALGVRARARIVENFSLPKIAGDYKTLYDAVLASPSHRAA